MPTGVQQRRTRYQFSTFNTCSAVGHAALRPASETYARSGVKSGRRTVCVATYQVPPKADEIAAAHSFGANRPHHHDPGSPPNIRREALSNSTSTAPTQPWRRPPCTLHTSPNSRRGTGASPSIRELTLAPRTFAGERPPHLCMGHSLLRTALRIMVFSSSTRRCAPPLLRDRERHRA